MSYFRPQIDAMSGYVPGEQPSPGTKVIKLNTNENPYPPSPKAMAVLQQLSPEQLRRYPHPMAEQFRIAAHEALGVPPSWVLVGNGSDDLLTMIVRACTEPGRSIVYPAPTYVLYQTLADIQGTETIAVPYPDNYTLPVDDLIAAKGAVTFVASPNSPSGTLVPIQTLEKLAQNLDGVLVIDEAYTDFAQSHALPLVRSYDNVIVLRTLSKGYSLAGLRLGFGIANPDLLAGLIKVKDSYNVDAIACLVGAAAIADNAYKNANADKIKSERDRVTSALTDLGFYVFPSQANFILADASKLDMEAESLYKELKEKGILVRYFNQPRLADKLRITIGTPEENQALIDAIAALLD